MICVPCWQSGRQTMLTVPTTLRWPAPSRRQHPLASTWVSWFHRTNRARYTCRWLAHDLGRRRPAGPHLQRECLGRILPQLRETLSERPWAKPEPSANGNLAQLMTEVPGRR